MRLHDNREIQSLSDEIDSVLRTLRSYRQKTFRMQINPMIHTLQILEYLEGAFEKSSAHLPSMRARENASFFFDEPTERSIFDSLYSVYSYLHMTGEAELEVFRREYLAFKESLPTRDLEDLHGVLHITKAILEELSKRIVD